MEDKGRVLNAENVTNASREARGRTAPNVAWQSSIVGVEDRSELFLRRVDYGQQLRS